jgi:hypothetical protein
MKIKQATNRITPQGMTGIQCQPSDLRPPENIGVKELKTCYDGWTYSWQVAPLQSLFPLHSSKTNI